MLKRMNHKCKIIEERKRMGGKGERVNSSFLWIAICTDKEIKGC